MNTSIALQHYHERQTKWAQVQHYSNEMMNKHNENQYSNYSTNNIIKRNENKYS